MVPLVVGKMKKCESEIASLIYDCCSFVGEADCSRWLKFLGESELAWNAVSPF